MLTVYIGRFQPIHFGHVETIKSALTRSERVLIIVGSSENEISFRNPFTFDERVDLIKGTIRELIPQDRHNDILIEGVADVNNDVKWKDSIVEIIRKHESNPSNVELTGVDKDHTTYYLKFFSEYPLVLAQHAVINATDIRESVFYHNTVPENCTSKYVETFLHSVIKNKLYKL